jgi:hypothetical protein
MKALSFVALIAIAAALTFALWVQRDASLTWIGWGSVIVSVGVLLAAVMVDVGDTDRRFLWGQAAISVALLAVLAVPLLQSGLALGVAALGVLALASLTLAFRSGGRSHREA